MGNPIANPAYDLLRWIEAQGRPVTAAEAGRALGHDRLWAARRLIKIYRAGLLHRRLEPARGEAWQYLYWISDRGSARLRWLESQM